MNAKTVQDIMVPIEEYPCIPGTLTIGDAIIEMTVQIRKDLGQSFPRVALVFDEDFSDLRGMLRRRDIMRGLEPQFLVSGSLDYWEKLIDVKVDPNLAEMSYDKAVARIRTYSKRLVRDYMSPIRATISHSDHIMKAMCKMVDRDVSMLPVLHGRAVIGVVRSIDVLREVAMVI
jgi:CBS domain-containing protein